MSLSATGEYLSLNQVIERYDLSRKSIYNLREKGKLTFYKLGKKSYVRKSEFETLMIQESPSMKPAIA